MIRASRLVCTITLASALLASHALAAPVGTAFTYQGQVLKNGTPATGTYNLQFKLFNDGSPAVQVGVTQTINNVAVSMGLFTVSLDFGSGAFDGNGRSIEIAVQGPGDLGFTTLAPRQPVTATPYAQFALNGGGGGLTLPFTGGSTTPGGSSFTIANGATTGTSPAITGRSASTGLSAPAILGEATGTASSVIGVQGKALQSPTGFGVEGDGAWVGVYGEGGPYGVSGKGTNYGVYGTSTTGKGVYGVSTYDIGVYANSFHSTALYATSGEAWGVYGTSSAAGFAGVFGQTSVAASSGVLGRNETTDANSQAVFGYSSQNALGVLGISERNDAVVGRSNGDAKSGVVGIATQPSGWGGYFFNTAPGGASLRVDGIAQVRTLQILGGADLAERFEGDPAAEPGTVMAIDAAAPGRLEVCREAYCARVAGVVSGANALGAGVTLGDQPDPARTVPLALSGRVWVKCDASAAPIRAGDLLTTSPRAGHAMRALDRDRAGGAILGKAMSTLEAGTGLVLVLVSLQ